MNPRCDRGIQLLRRPLRPALLSLVCASLLSLVATPDARAQETIKIGGTGTTLGTMRLLGAAFEKANPGTKVTVLSSLGSTGGIKAAISGAVDIGVSGRPLTDAERGQGATAIEYGRAPLVFAVSRTTAASELTTAQLVDIYAGRLTQWPDGTPIRLILRTSGDINTILLKAMSAPMKDAVTAAEKRPGMLFALTDQETIEQVEKVPGSMSPTSLSEIVSETSRLKALKINGVEPTARAIADGTYPVYHTFYLVAGKTPSALTQRFVAFVRSEAARPILTDTGHWLADTARR